MRLAKARSSVLLACCALAAAAGCGGKPRPAVAAPPALEAAVRELPFQAPCSSRIPAEWSVSWPVPAGGSPTRFKAFFFPVARAGARGLRLHAPLGEAEFELGREGALDCRRLPGEPKPLALRASPESGSGQSPEGPEERRRRLYALGERAASLYAAGGAPSPKDAELLREYGALFLELADEPLLPFYYRLNPAFWDWLRGAGAPIMNP